MKKKIKDFTLKEVTKYCDQRFDCENCPFQPKNIKYDCLSLCIDNINQNLIDEEIEVEDDEEK